MKYFIPEWDDMVDPEYDFLNEKHSEAHKRGKGAYLWDIFGYDNAPIDGILVSRTKVMINKAQYDALLTQGVHEYYRFPGEIIGDCGAFGYIEEDEPPFKTRETLDYYLKAGFDYGVSIDHLIVRATMNQKERRFRITLENAREMY